MCEKVLDIELEEAHENSW